MTTSKPVTTRPFAGTSGSPAGRLRRFSRAWLPVGLDLLFPPECAHCQIPMEPGNSARLCEDCAARFVAKQPACPRCGCQLHQGDAVDGCHRCMDQKWHFTGVTRLGEYEAMLRSAVLRIKQPHERALAVTLGDLLAEKVVAAQVKVDAALPVPMHWSRRIWRGANSPETITSRVAARLGIPAAGHLLVRRRRTAPQASLSAAGRRKNVRGAFAVRPHPDLAGARLLVIDDIMTTGATLDEAAKCLVKAGAQSVHVAVVARAEGLV